MKMENEYLLVEAKAAGAELTRVYDKELAASAFGRRIRLFGTVTRRYCFRS